MGENKYELYLQAETNPVRINEWRVIQYTFMGGNNYKLYLWAETNTSCIYGWKQYKMYLCAETTTIVDFFPPITTTYIGFCP